MSRCGSPSMAGLATRGGLWLDLSHVAISSPGFRETTVGLPSKSENRLFSFWMVLRRNMQIALEEQTRKTSLLESQGVGPGGGLWETGIGLPRLRESGYYWHPSGPLPPWHLGRPSEQHNRKLLLTEHSPGTLQGPSAPAPHTLCRGCCAGCWVSLAVEGRPWISSISVSGCPITYLLQSERS